MNFLYVTHQHCSHKNMRELTVTQSAVNWIYCLRGEILNYKDIPGYDFKQHDVMMIFLSNLPETIDPYLQLVEKHPCSKVIVYLDGPVGVHCNTMLPEEKTKYMQIIRKADYVFTWAEDADSYFEIMSDGKKIHHVNIPYPIDYIRSVQTNKKYKSEIAVEMGKGFGGRRYERNTLGSWGTFAALQKRFPDIRALAHPNHDPAGSGEQRVNGIYMEEIFGIDTGTAKSGESKFLELRMAPWMHYVRELSPCYMAIHLDMLYTRGQFQYECAGLKIPCICSGSDAGRKLYPRTFLDNPFNIAKAIEIGTRLIEDEKFYEEVVEYAERKLIEDHSYEAVQHRVLEILDKLPKSFEEEKGTK